MPPNDYASDRYTELDRANLNRPVHQLVCPRCEADGAAKQDDGSDHPGCFECGVCGHSYLA